MPKRNRPFWTRKFEENRRRDARALAALRRTGFRVVVVWECEVEKRPERVLGRLASRLGAPAQRTRKREA